MRVLYVYIPRNTRQRLTQAIHFSRPTLQLQTLSNLSQGINKLYNVIPCGSKWLCFIRSRYEKSKQRTLNQGFIELRLSHSLMSAVNYQLSTELGGTGSSGTPRNWFMGGGREVFFNSNFSRLWLAFAPPPPTGAPMREPQITDFAEQSADGQKWISLVNLFTLKGYKYYNYI